MFFLFEYFQNSWAAGTEARDAADKANWEDTWNRQEKERQRDRILAWRDRVAHNDYAANSEDSEFYYRSAGTVWRFQDPTGTHKARNHQYLYNLEVLGHKTYSRRDPQELAAAHADVATRVASGELGALSPVY